MTRRKKKFPPKAEGSAKRNDREGRAAGQCGTRPRLSLWESQPGRREVRSENEASGQGSVPCAAVRQRHSELSAAAGSARAKPCNLGSGVASEDPEIAGECVTGAGVSSCG